MTIYVIRLHVLLNLTIEQSQNPTKKNMKTPRGCFVFHIFCANPVTIDLGMENTSGRSREELRCSMGISAELRSSDRMTGAS